MRQTHYPGAEYIAIVGAAVYFLEGRYFLPIGNNASKAENKCKKKARKPFRHEVSIDENKYKKKCLNSRKIGTGRIFRINRLQEAKRGFVALKLATAFPSESPSVPCCQTSKQRGL